MYGILCVAVVRGARVRGCDRGFGRLLALPALHTQRQHHQPGIVVVVVVVLYVGVVVYDTCKLALFSYAYIYVYIYYLLIYLLYIDCIVPSHIRFM